MNAFTVSRRTLLAGTAGLGVAAGVGVAGVPSPAGAATPALRLSADRWAVAASTAHGPDADGRLPAADWAAADELVGFEEFHSGESAPDVGVAVLAGPSRLHLRLRISRPEAARPDTVELLFRSPASPDLFRLIIPVRSAAVPPQGSWGETTVRTFRTIVPAVTDTAGEFTAEFGIAYNSFGGATGTAGQEWAFNAIGLYGVGDRPSWAWTPLRGAMVSDTGKTVLTVLSPLHEEDRLGRIFLRSLPSGWGEPWRPDLVEATVIDRTSHSIVVSAPPCTVADVALAWAEPRQEWSPIGTARHRRRPLRGDASGLTVYVDHPAMTEPGRHSLQITLTGTDGSTWSTIIDHDREGWVRYAAATLPTGAGGGTRTPVSAQPSAEALALLEMVPDRSGMYFCGLPEDPSLRPERVFTFDPANPSVLTSSHSALTYPNEQYPESHSIEVPVGDTTVNYPYHEDADGRRYFFSAHLWYLKRQHVLMALPELAETDPAGTARIIHAFAQAYRTYVPTNDYIWHNYPVSPQSGPPYPSWGGVWARWSKSELWYLGELVRAYLLIKDTSAFDDLSAELGVDVEQFVINEMFVPSTAFIDTLPTSHYNYANWTGLALMGRAIPDPDHVHKATELLNEFVDQNFLFDGFHLLQTVSYHIQLADGTFGTIDAIDGWTDPTGYVSPRTGLRLEDADLRTTLPVLAQVERLPGRLTYPNGRALPVQDTWPSQLPADPELGSGTWNLPASGIVRLARPGADGADAATAYLEFHPKYLGHIHQDALNLCLWDQGQELLPDVGYTHTNYRMWTRSQLAHNTVVVDGADMVVTGQAQHGGSLRELMVTPEVQFASAEQAGAYDQVSEYARDLLMIKVPGRDRSYYVDLFRVAGGDRHEYTLNGDANAESTASTDVQLEHYGDHLLPPGVVVTPPTSATDTGDAEGHYYGYIYVRDVKHGTPGAGVATVDFSSAESFPGEPYGAGLRVHLATEDGDELFLGRSQCLRATRLEGRPSDINSIAEDGPGVPRYTMPKLVLRREGTALSSQFRAIMEPTPAGGSSEIAAVQRLPLTGSADATAWRITFTSGATHLVLLSPTGQPVSAGGAELVGRGGVVQLEEGRQPRLWLVGGTSLQYDGVAVSDAGELTGELVGVLRTAGSDASNALVVSGSFPADVVGRYAVVHHPDGSSHGYRIEGHHTDGSTTTLELGPATEPGLAGNPADGFALAYHPFTSWDGAHQVSVQAIAGNA
ncbi:heparinase II/III domain-containing protein [Propionibacteriaceae bacterium Y2011]